MTSSSIPTRIWIWDFGMHINIARVSECCCSSHVRLNGAFSAFSTSRCLPYPSFRTSPLCQDLEIDKRHTGLVSVAPTLVLGLIYSAYRIHQSNATILDLFEYANAWQTCGVEIVVTDIGDWRTHRKHREGSRHASDNACADKGHAKKAVLTN